MSRLAQAFERAAAEERAALVGYLTGGDPNEGASLRAISAACEAGLDVLELGVPFSDPTADGPDIQAAMSRALEAGANLDAVLRIGQALRERFPDLPIVLFSYANPLLRRGEALWSALTEAGIDALLVVDAPPEVADRLRDPAIEHGLDWVGLVAPTSPPARRERVVQNASGFCYAVSLTGVTGAALDASSESLHAQLADLRARTDLPIAVGFGIRQAEQVRALANLVDGVVVGSALVRAAAEGEASLAQLVRSLHVGTRRAAPSGV